MAPEKFSADALRELPLASWGEGKAIGSLPPSSITGKAFKLPGYKVTGWGVWEASAGSFAREIEAAEYMHILSGECTFVWEGGEMSISAGDHLFFPAQTKGAWHIKSPVRKLYMLLVPLA